MALPEPLARRVSRYRQLRKQGAISPWPLLLWKVLLLPFVWLSALLFVFLIGLSHGPRAARDLWRDIA